MLRFDYKPRLKIDLQSLRSMFQYTSSSYIANLFNIAPTLVLPLIVINRLGSAEAGYYYLAFTVASLLYAIVYAVSASLFTEGSYGEVALKKLVKRSTLIITAIMIPSGAILAVFGPLVLRVFGKSYSDGGSNALIIFALAAPAVVAYTLTSVLLRITNKTYSIVIVNIIYFITISGLAMLWAGYGLVWIAIAWTVGNLIAAVAALLLMFYK
jgi:O-antigen/teichoic acid export membrane protein